MPQKARNSKIDRRLLGTWKSDARRTFAEWNWKKGTGATKRTRLKSFFGKLEISYTRTRVISRLPYRQWEQSQQYAVLGADNDSVAIVIFGKLKIKNRKRYDPVNLLCSTTALLRMKGLSTLILARTGTGSPSAMEEIESSFAE